MFGLFVYYSYIVDSYQLYHTTLILININIILIICILNLLIFSTIPECDLGGEERRSSSQDHFIAYFLE